MQQYESKPGFEWDELMTAQEVADLTRVNLVTFRRWVVDGKGPIVTELGGVMRFARSDVLRWVHESKVARVAENDNKGEL